MESTQKSYKTTPQCIFYFDIVCPFAFIAHHRIDDIARFTKADITWQPVLLGGLYHLSEAAQGKDGSATDVMPEAKKKIVSRQFQNDINRYQIKFKFHPQHPLQSLDAARLLCSFPTHLRPRLARSLYNAYWVENLNITSRTTLIRIAKSLKLKKLGFELNESIFDEETWSIALRQNTSEAFESGAFGVPWFWLPQRQKGYFGQDRMHLVEAELHAIRNQITLDQLQSVERLQPRCLRTPAENRPRQLRFWFDFSSPWSYLAWTQMERIQREAGPALKIIYKPFLLGALFKSIGTPLLPSTEQSALRQRYNLQDLMDWSHWFSAVNQQEYPPLPRVNLKWPDQFPIKSVVALRISILEPKFIDCIYRAAWRDNENISDVTILKRVLVKSNLAPVSTINDLMKEASSENGKSRLKRNTSEAIELGLCGAPTMELISDTGGRKLIWGSDRINILQDMISGWHPDKSKLRATVATFPSFDYRI